MPGRVHRVNDGFHYAADRGLDGGRLEFLRGSHYLAKSYLLSRLYLGFGHGPPVLSQGQIDFFRGR